MCPILVVVLLAHLATGSTVLLTSPLPFLSVATKIATLSTEIAVYEKAETVPRMMARELAVEMVDRNFALEVVQPELVAEEEVR